MEEKKETTTEMTWTEETKSFLKVKDNRILIWRIVVTVLLVVLIGMCIGLKHDIANKDLSVSTESVNMDYDSLESDIQDMLNGQNSILTGFTVKVGDFDYEKLQGAVTFTFTPKEVASDATGYAEISGKKCELTKDGANYSCEVTFGLKDKIQVTSVSFVSDGKTTTENMETYWCPEDEFIDEDLGLVNGMSYGELRLDSCSPNISWSESTSDSSGNEYWGFSDSVFVSIPADWKNSTPVFTYYKDGEKQSKKLHKDADESDASYIMYSLSGNTVLADYPTSDTPVSVSFKDQYGLEYRFTYNDDDMSTTEQLFDADGNKLCEEIL